MNIRRFDVMRIATAILSVVLFFEHFVISSKAIFARAEDIVLENYSIEYNVSDYWDGGYSADIILNNLTDTDIENWQISFCTYDKITNLWGGNITECLEIEENQNNKENTSKETASEKDDEAQNAIDEAGIYYQYTVEALDYNCAIANGQHIIVGYNANGDNYGIWGANAELFLDEVKKEENSVDIPVGGIYEGNGYVVEVKVPKYWDGAYNIQLFITNTGVDTIHNWAFVMNTTDTISGLYNAVELTSKNNVHLIKNAGYNQDIPAGGSVEIGYTSYYEKNFDVPNDFALSTIEKEVSTEECEVSLIVSEKWEDGGLAYLILTNTTDVSIEDWILEFDSSLEIVNMWDGMVDKHEGEHYYVRNVEYAHNILPCESATVGILFSGDVADIRNIKVKQIVADVDTTMNTVKENPAPYIQYMDTKPSEYTEDIGEVFFKEIASEDDMILNVEGGLCVRDQLLLVMKDGVLKSQVEDLVARNGFRIVGYIALTGDYQIESVYSLSAEELQDSFNKIVGSTIVDHVAYNYISMTSGDFGSNDSFEGCTSVDDWGTDWTTTPAGNNWGVEAIDFTGALINAGVIADKSCTSEDVDNNLPSLESVRIGLIDDGFYTAHEDLNYTQVWNNYQDGSLKDVDGNNIYNNEHGTHVSGIMAAEFNNGKGISGTSIKSQLYGFSLKGKLGPYKEATQLFKIKCGFVLLIGNNVKVINYSQGVINDQIAIVKGNSKVKAQFEKRSSEIENLLERLIYKGYDFLIVTSAGNGNYDPGTGRILNSNMWYYSGQLASKFGNGYIRIDQDIPHQYFYSSLSGPVNYPENHWGDGALYAMKNNADARYNSELNWSKKLENRIICVGAMCYDPDTNDYYQCDFSCRVSRVDIFAPGEDIYHVNEGDGIYSCVPDGYSNTQFLGTSMAAPYVAGIAGLAYSVDPNLSATDLKNYIINSYNMSINSIPILDAAAVIETVVKYKAGNNHPIENNDSEGFIAGVAWISDGTIDSRGDMIKQYAEGATVEISSKDGAYNETINIDSEGTYEFFVPYGVYDLKFQMSGYDDVEIDDIKVTKHYMRVPNDVILMQSSNKSYIGEVLSIYNGNAIKGVNVDVLSSATGEIVYNTITDEYGSYRIPYSKACRVEYSFDNYKMIAKDIDELIYQDIGEDIEENCLIPVYMEFSYPMGWVTGRVVDTNGQSVDYNRATPLLKFNRIGVVGDEPLQAPDYNLFINLNPRYSNGRFGDGSYHVLLPVGRYQILCGAAASGCDTAISDIIEVTEFGDTRVPDIVLDLSIKIDSYPTYYNAHVKVIDIVTGKSIENAKTCVMFGGTNAYSSVGNIGNPTYYYADQNGEVNFQYNGSAIKLAVFAEGYKDRAFNINASVNGKIVYCAMIPDSAPEPDWKY